MPSEGRESVSPEAELPKLLKCPKVAILLFITDHESVTKNIRQSNYSFPVPAFVIR